MIDQLTLLQVMLLGVVEGLTEFIPVSSTGHLIILGKLLSFEGPPGKVFEIVIQLGAIFAVLWVYRATLMEVSQGIIRRNRQACRFAYTIILAFIPAAILGALFHKEIKTLLFSPLIVSINLVIGGIIILVIERYKPRARYYAVDNIRYKTAFAIGCAQALAMVPGVSRSGATIMGSVLLGVERKAATEFSFFLAIPTMLGATLFDLYMNWQSLTFHSLEMIGIGFVCAFFAGLVVVKTLIAFISTHGFTPFAWYRIVVGLCMLYLFI